MYGGETTNITRIQPKQTDSESSYTSGSEETAKARNTSESTLHTGAPFAPGVLLFFILLIPVTVHAATVSNALPAHTLTYEAPTTRKAVDEVTLLRSGINADPHAALGGGDVIVNEGALVTNGPFGADVYETGDGDGEISVYTVREGDSLSEIAEMFDVTTNTIMWANDMDSATISPGQELVILPIVGVRHVVKSGDTVASIAKKYEADTSEVRSYNQLAATASLSVGDTLIIPGGNMHTSAPKQTSTTRHQKSTASVTAAGGSYFTHPLPGSVRTQGIHGYNAVDLAAAAGSPIRAAAAGEVIVARSGGWNGGYGTYLVLKHPNGTQTLYAHNSSNTVGVGAYVRAGEVVGYVGTSGRSTGSHLHFEVRGASNPF